MSFWRGNINLTPASDNWVDTERLEANIINVEGDFTQQVEDLGRRFGVDPQNGFGSVIWNSWETIWSGITGEEIDITPTLSIEEIGRDSNTIFQRWTRTARRAFQQSVTTQERRTGTRAIVAEQFDRTSQGTRSISRELIAFMRSRNVQFVVNRVKPSTRQYAFLDGIDVTKYCVPKLIEISMVSGTFQVGERITGTTRPLGVLPITNYYAEASIRFRVAQSNHLEGPYNAPTRIYGTNPYGNGTIPADYSTTSTTVNVDTFSLANQPQGSYWGWVEQDMILVGETSGAMATVSNVRLVSDIGSNLIGSLFIPNPNISNNPRFETGDKVFTLINNCLLYTSPSPRDRTRSRMPSSA